MNKETLQHIELAKKGNQASFNYLLDAFWSNVYAYQFKKIGNEIDAEDITIQTFAKAFNKIDSFNPEYQFSTWLIAISKNLHYDLLRKRKSSIITKSTSNETNEVYDIVDDTPTPEDKIIREQNLAKLLKNIKKLQPKYQEVINLRFFQELSYKEIATQINEPMNNVKVKLLRAKKLLADIIRNNNS
ncbi:sigma-70 family RNA polymerase sigma factor [Tenacibaculum sp. M341]|uniref:RNA polymerase sigma factor n=1 Tax=uncultured Tenacibaculum sp. TaxID=174713 RepID=UPI00104DC259|nr:sigma-70 family RNA polymerase sigma factor [Tenacibaculum sp. M341]TCI94753.1 sigma-70 family RNA polymerase sigma factor [Tenacibaculum sp. M341]